VELDAAQTGVNNFNSKLAELKSKVNAMRARVNDTAGWWEGDTGTTFRDSFDRACSFFENTLTSKLEAHAQRMLSSVQAQHDQDANLASRISRH
jgi:uncharacterized protein YukE